MKEEKQKDDKVNKKKMKKRGRKDEKVDKKKEKKGDEMRK
jgi:hypothetical protein